MYFNLKLLNDFNKTNTLYTIIMKIFISYVLSTIFYFFYGLSLLIFHPIQVLSRNIGGYHAHKKSVDILNYCMLNCFRILGCKINLKVNKSLPTDKPLIIVSNHQSIFDITPVICGFTKHHPKFISKIELGKNLPSVSYNLKHSGSALIDRSNGMQSIKEIVKLGRLIEKNNYSACIYPEGTRSKTGKLRRFHEGGLKTLLKAAPSALIVPFVVDGNYKLHLKGMFPLNIGVTLNYIALDPIDQKDLSVDEILQNTEDVIKRKLEELRKK